MLRSRHRGFMLFDSLAATLVLGISIAGLLGLWGYCHKKVSDAGGDTLSGELARGELERAKAFGYSNLPLGDFDPVRMTATWSGSFVPRNASAPSTWQEGGVSTFDGHGVRVSSSDPAVRYSIQTTIVDSDVAIHRSKLKYDLGPGSRRSVEVVVRKLPHGTVTLRMGTEIVRGGV